MTKSWLARTYELSNRGAATAATLAVLLVLTALMPPIVVGPEYVTLSLFVVVLGALLLNPLEAALSIGVYLLLGAVGVPVFPGGDSGMAVLTGQTGGYLIGFLVGGVGGCFVRMALTARKLNSVLSDLAAAAAVVILVDALGAAQLSAVAHVAFASAIALGIGSFLVADLVMAAAAIGVAAVTRRVLQPRERVADDSASRAVATARARLNSGEIGEAEYRDIVETLERARSA